MRRIPTQALEPDMKTAAAIALVLAAAGSSRGELREWEGR